MGNYSIGAGGGGYGSFAAGAKGPFAGGGAIHWTPLAGEVPPWEHHASVKIDVTVAKDAAVAIAKVQLDGESYTLSSASKRNPKDAFDEQIAYDLAVARLLEKVSKKLYRRANGAVKHAEDMRLYRKKQKRTAQQRGND